MVKCPECQANIAKKLKVCPKCGYDLVASKPAKSGGDTLDVAEHFGLDDPSSNLNQADGDATIDSVANAMPGMGTARLSMEEAAATDKAAESAAAELSAAESDPTGSGTLDPAMGLTPDPRDIEATSREMIAEGTRIGTSVPKDGEPGQASRGFDETIDSIQGPGVGDEIKTVVVGSKPPAGSGKDTAMYSDADIREAMSGSRQTSGAIKDAWAGAAGSDDNPSNTMRGDGGLASDSLFRRVASRRVAQANAPADAQADYVLMNKLGQGGMGVVYSARQTNVDRIVALKAIKPEWQSSDDNQRKFFYEAQITADLDHPNIVPIYELGRTEDGLLFYSMKLITGTEWKDVIKTKSREENLEILSKINDAMAFAHSKGIVHRDLKPANTMLGPYGEVYVTDWGLGVNIRKKHGFGAGGSPAYMAPEMAWHRIKDIGPASDIYVLGAILYQIITGHPPHPGRTAEECLRAAARNEIISRQSEDALMPIAMRALATNPADRYKTVEDFQDALREYRQHGESIALAQRCEELLVSANEKKDYDLFSRAVFGYRDAVELWPENEVAKGGLKRAQLEYGRCAVSKGDYDLAMQTLDRNDREQAPIYALAVKGKEQVAGREKRLKSLRRAIAAVVLAAVGVSSTLAVFALFQWRAAEKNFQIAETEKKVAIDAKQQEEVEKQKAIAEKERAERQEKIANDAKLAEMASALRAREAQLKAEDEEKKARAAEAGEKDQRMLAEANAEKAREEEKKAKAATLVAEKRAAEIQLGEYQSKLALAKSQIETFDVKASTENLGKLQSLDNVVFPGKAPKTNTWPWQRVRLLSNEDLPRTNVGSTPNTLDFAAAMNISVVGTKSGKVQIISHAGDKLVDLGSYEEPGAEIVAVAISPKADEVIYNFRRGDESGFRVWKLNAGKPQGDPVPVVAAAKKSLQGLAYSSDGEYVVAGINNGVWLWKRSEKWYEEKDVARQYKKTQGMLKSLSITGPDQAIVGSLRANADGLTLYVLDLTKPDTSRAIQIPAGIKVSVVNYDVKGKQLILGADDGRLYTAALRPGAKDALELSDVKEILPSKHRTAIEHIAVEASGQMLTLSAEPVAHVWRRDATGSWNYDTNLTGTPENIKRAVFVGPGKAMGIDAGGMSIAWDIERQKQYRQLTRKKESVATENNAAEQNNAEENANPIVELFPRADGRIVSVDSQSVIDVWNIRDGKTVTSDGQRFAFYGHTPGAEFVDSAVDSEAGIVVTLARLSNVNPIYLEGKPAAYEFCLWDQQSGQMKKRWREDGKSKVDKQTTASANKSKESEQKQGAIDLRLSLVDHGRALILASDTETRIQSLDGKELFYDEDFATYFAMPHPQQPNLLMLVMRSGAVRLLDLNNKQAWSQSPREYALNTISDTPLEGIWSPEGKHFYLTFTSGAVAAFDWNGSKIALTWSSHRLEGDSQSRELQEVLADKALRVKSHADVDMAVKVTGNKETLVIARRARGARGSTELTAIDFPASAAPKLVEYDPQKGIMWLESSQASPQLSSRLHNRLKIDNDQVFARRSVNGQTFITTNTANVYRLVEGSTEFVSYGRQKLLDATSDLAVDVVLMLHEDGTLIKAAIPAEGAPQLSKHAFTLPGAHKIELSPDGKLLAVFSGDANAATVRVVDAETGAEVQRVAALMATWIPGAAAQLAVCDPAGKLSSVTAAGVTPLAQGADLSDVRLMSIHYLQEDFSDEKLEPAPYLMIHSESDKTAYVQFVPLTGDKAADPRQEILAWKNKRVSVSPTEQVIVTGDDLGTVNLWFANPTWSSEPKVLYELEGHRGAAIELAKFTPDGTTLISSDAKRRVFGWLSKDNLGK